jgi:2-phospho-L-lactate guanylyltransferase
VSLRWVVVVPLKRLDQAKTRLECAGAGHRRHLARAMAETVLATASCVPCVAEVLLVTREPWADVPAGVSIVREPPAAGLNAALRHASDLVRRTRGEHAVAALPADAAAGTATELAACLEAAARHPRALVGDADGTGTVLLTAAPGVALRPAFGPSSRDRHVRSGAVDLTDQLDVPLLRRDLDTAEDLAAVDGRLRQLAGMDAALRLAGWSGQAFAGAGAAAGVVAP